MTPDDAKKRLQQLKAEAMMRADKEKQYKAAMKNKHARDMVSFEEWSKPKHKAPQAEAHNQARLNAAKMLGLHEHNTPEERAKAMGFDLEAFHGTDAPDIKSLDPERTKIIKGVFSTTNPSVASTYAKGAQEKSRAGSESAPNIIPLLLRSASHSKPHPSASWNKDLIDSFKKSGHKGVYRPESEVAVTFDPSQMRSRFAAFDPAREHEHDLLAARGGSIHMAGGGSDIPKKVDLTRLYRGGYNPEPYEAKDTGVYGGLFASGIPESASSHGPHLHYTDIPTNKILTHYALNYEVPHEKVKQALIKAAPHVKEDKKLFDKLHDVVVGDKGQDLRNLDDDEIYNLLRKESGADADNEAQRLRGQIAKHLGYHAVELEDEHGQSYLTTHGVKFKPHVTKAKGGPIHMAGGGQPPSLDVMKLALTQHGMYSPLEKATMGVNRTKGTPAEFMAEIAKQPGFRKDEVADRKIQLPDQKLTKAEMMQHLQKSPMPNVSEKVLHDFGDEEEALDAAAQHLFGQSYDEIYDDRKAREKVNNWIKANSSKYSTYQLPGGKNYREVLLQTPHFAEHDEHRIMELEADKRRSPQPSHWGMATGEAKELADLMKRKAGMGEQYHSSHFEGHPNILAHMRMSDREAPGEMGYTLINKKSGFKSPHFNTPEEAKAALEAYPESIRGSLEMQQSQGPKRKLLHLEEIQSDWHQAGRKKGYHQNLKELPEGYKIRENVDPRGFTDHSVLDENGKLMASGVSAEGAKKNALENLNRGQRVPDAPFKKNWHELALKHALHHAAKHGYHGVVITPGKEQADRYSLSKQVEAVRANLNPDGTYQLGVQPIGKNMQKHETSVKAEKLDELLGKELAEKIRSGVTDPGVDNGKVFSGLDLNVGGEGMKGFYDKIIPDYLNKLGKSHGVKVGSINVPAPQKGEPYSMGDVMEHHGMTEDQWRNTPVPRRNDLQMQYSNQRSKTALHHFPITEPMRQQILQGQPMYKQGGIIHKAEGGNVQPNIAQMRMALQQRNPIEAQNIGVNEAPNMLPKIYFSPSQNENDDPTVGNSFNQDGMPIGGVDQDQQQPGQQLMAPQQPGQPPQGAQPPQGGLTPQGGLQSGPQGPTPPMGNMLSMTPQGQAMQAMGGAPQGGPPGAPTQPAPTGMADGGGVHGYANGDGVTRRDQTVSNPQRMAYSGIYKRPDVIASEAAARVAPEDPILKQLFGVTRADMYAQANNRLGAPHLGKLPGAAADPQGTDPATNVMTKRNEQRLLDVLDEAKNHESLVHGMEPWYYMDPLFQHMVRLLGMEKAIQEFKKMNALGGMASSSSEVNAEIPRGSLAYYLQNQGRFNEFVEHGGKRDPNRPADFGETPGHIAHKTAHALPMQKFLTRGEVDMGSPKVPMYIEASGVPETGFQTTMPVGDAHWSRAVGLADTRNKKMLKGKEVIPGQSGSNAEMAVLGPWWQHKIAHKMGLQSVPAQALAWGAFSPQTGVTTPIGAPKLELIAQQIRHTAKRLGVSPETARDLVLTGKERMGKKKGGDVKLAPTQDTMRLALTKKKAK